MVGEKKELYTIKGKKNLKEIFIIIKNGMEKVMIVMEIYMK